MKGGAKVVVEPHRHEGVFIARGKEDALCTLNSAPGKVGFEMGILFEPRPARTGCDVEANVNVQIGRFSQRLLTRRPWHEGFGFRVGHGSGSVE